jgi:O-antigen ligase
MRSHLLALLRSPLLPLWAVIALLPFGRSAEAGVVFAAIGAIFLFLRMPQALDGHPGARLLLALWACYIGAAAISAVDAIDLLKSWGTVAAALRFAPLGLYACFAIRRYERLRELYRGVAFITALWLLDAWVQALFGVSLGGPAEAHRLSGIFGAENLKIGPVLAVLAPFVLWVARERWGRRGLIAAFLVLLVPVLLAGSRAAWLGFGLVCLGFVWREVRRPAQFLGVSAALALAVTIAAAAAWQFSPAFDARIEKTLHALEGSRDGVDVALAGRLRIWRTSFAMIEAHPINGVGVRDFRYAYPQYSEPGDDFLQQDGSGAAHAHQIVLEVLSETGVLGLLLWGFGAFLALRAWWRADAQARERALAPALGLVAMTFPLNTHLAFYSAWWGLLFWWLLAIYCAALHANADETP